MKKIMSTITTDPSLIDIIASLNNQLYCTTHLLGIKIRNFRDFDNFQLVNFCQLFEEKLGGDPLKTLFHFGKSFTRQGDPDR